MSALYRTLFPSIHQSPLFGMSQSSPKESYVDVLIIGAGPSGVMGANALVQAGVNVCIVDKRYVFSIKSCS